ARRLDADPNLIAVDLHHGHDDVVADDDLLSQLPAQNQHGSLRLWWWRGVESPHAGRGRSEDYRTQHAWSMPERCSAPEVVCKSKIGLYLKCNAILGRGVRKPLRV